MAITTYQGWVNNGRPIKPAVCIADWIATLRRHGYEVGYYPDERHLKAQPPEDHTPYSHTSWPGIQPYPYVLGSDLMPPTKTGLPTLAQIGARIVLDKQKGVPGTEFIKYINWTDTKGNCWHDEWEPTYRRSSSNDRGHIHISARTDWVLKHTSYDPVAIILGDNMTPAQFLALLRDPAILSYFRATPLQYPISPTKSLLALHLEVAAQVAALTTVVQQLAAAIAAGGGTVDTAAILAGVDARLAALANETRDAVADLGEGGAAQVRADGP